MADVRILSRRPPVAAAPARVALHAPLLPSPPTPPVAVVAIAPQVLSAPPLAPAPVAVGRRARLVDCRPRWGTDLGERADRYLTFDCPEGHPRCRHSIPFTPTLDGSPNHPAGGATWDRIGSDFATLTLAPSIRRVPTAIDPCHAHVNLTNGVFEFCGDSGPVRVDGEIPLCFLREVGVRAVLRVYWDGPCGTIGYHDAKVHLADSLVVDDFTVGGEPRDYPIERWPDKCDRCGAPRPADLPDHARQVFHTRLYAAPGGDLVDEREMIAGDCFFATWLHDKTGKCWYWSNCSSPHLHVVLPDGHTWDTSSRASNCDKKDDTTHRCWVVHGDPSKGECVTVDKAGATCGAGAGSIASRGYHGMLIGGVLRRC